MIVLHHRRAIRPKACAIVAEGIALGDPAPLHRALSGRSKTFFASLGLGALALKPPKLRNEPNFIQNLLTYKY